MTKKFNVVLAEGLSLDQLSVIKEKNNMTKKATVVTPTTAVAVPISPLAEQAHFYKNGNVKVGRNAWTFNKLAGSGTFNGVKGSCCDKYCNGTCYNPDNPKKSSCYVFKSYVQYGWESGTVVKSHTANTLAMRLDMTGTFEKLNLQLKRCHKYPNCVRIHAAGELESLPELKNWITLSSKYPDVPFYLYTKAYDIVDELMAEVLKGDFCIPENFTINISVWHETGVDCYKRWESNPCIKAFIYDDGFDYASTNLAPEGIKVYCPAYKKNAKGKVVLKHDITCDNCGLCFKHAAGTKLIGCLSH